MTTLARMRQYQQQAAVSSSPEQIILKLYDLGIAACHAGERAKLRAVLVELIGALDFERGGELAERLHALYTYSLRESADGDLQVTREILCGLREAWREAVFPLQAA